MRLPNSVFSAYKISEARPVSVLKTPAPLYLKTVNLLYVGIFRKLNSMFRFFTESIYTLEAFSVSLVQPCIFCLLQNACKRS